MKKLLIYLKNYKKESALGPFFKLVEVIFELMVPLVMASLIDNGIGMNNRSYILKMFAILIIFGICGLAASISAQYFAAKSAVSTGRDLRNDLFAHINTLSFKEIDTLGTSTLINRMTNDVNQVQNGINMFLRLFLQFQP